MLYNVVVPGRLSVIKMSRKHALYSHRERNSHGNDIMEVAAAALCFCLC